MVVSDTSVELQAGGHPSVTLARLEDQQAAEELRELLFRMADALVQHGDTCLCLIKEKKNKTLLLFLKVGSDRVKPSF